NTGTKPMLSKNNLLTTIAWKIGDTTHYALEGSVFIAGAVVQWLRDGLGVIRTSAEVEQLATSVEDNGGVYFVPAFAGLGAPYWNQHARGTMMGITRGTTAAHIARASIESIAFQTMDVLNAMNADAGIPIKELRVDGGATVNNLLMQFQSDMIDCRVVRPRITETTAAGAAYLAGLAIGFWKNLDEIQQYWKEEKTFDPVMQDGQRQQQVKKWSKAIKAAQVWAEDDN
ncbi:MAG TPA: FGGY-family carbohydrate kinase, partial [Chitinophagaceae bacterium]